MKIFITAHARGQMEERGIEESHIIKTIKRGSRINQTEGYLAIYGCVAVAYKIFPNNVYKIKTVMIT